jgi:hypothetical protein
MDTDFFFPDKVSIKRLTDGSAAEAKAQFSGSGEALLHGNGTIVSEGDTIVRRHDNGVVENYTVLNVDYQKGFGDLPAVTKLMLQKQGSNFSPHSQALQNIYNVTGPNARVNVQSQDSSVNVVNVNTSELFTNLKATLEKNVADESLKSQLLQAVQQMEAAQNGDSYTQKFQNFMALAANCMTLVTPFLPALTQLLR